VENEEVAEPEEVDLDLASSFTIEAEDDEDEYEDEYEEEPDTGEMQDKSGISAG
jgi:hypothetical protein